MTRRVEYSELYLRLERVLSLKERLKKLNERANLAISNYDQCIEMTDANARELEAIQ
ncbi:MAG: hypothetical protein NWE89_01570 [Candidatus Bathyarchaeota archaeon]|nr:hypothetical protein [Candidatus Bathyarchaeota archaeon]